MAFEVSNGTTSKVFRQPLRQGNTEAPTPVDVAGAVGVDEAEGLLKIK